MPIRLDRHAIMEASAGTGKTHQMVQLVCRLLIEENVDLEQILVVTFTDKATGELRSRLREELEERCKKAGPAERACVHAALDSFDQANISTIHGFCQRTLQEFAFENGQEFRAQLVSDPELLEICLREVQRTKWRAEFRGLLPSVLELAQYSKDLQGAETWEALVRELAGRYRPWCGHQLLPACSAGFAATVREREETLRRLWAEVRGLTTVPPPGEIENSAWYMGFGGLKFHATHRHGRLTKVLRPLLCWLADQAAEQSALVTFQHALQAAEDLNSFAGDGYRILSTKLPPKALAQLATLCPGLTEAVELIEEQRRATDWDALQHQLAIWTVKALQACLRDHKQQRGQVSFEDLLTGVATALDDPSGLLLAAMRAKYRYAIVDEFQDTDQIQWDIFRRIFVEGDTAHRLFIVGDPKQAIYGFLGADLCAYQNAVAQLHDEHGAAVEPLDTNWRSAPELLHGLNRLFGDGGWFGETGIEYRAVQAPPPAERRCFVPEGDDQTHRPALTLVNLSALETFRAARRHMAQFVVGEIDRLLHGEDGGPTLRVQMKNQPPRALRADDICILVARRSEADDLADLLPKAHIPFTLYKQTGLWQSAEAQQLTYVLRALARPTDAEAFRKALLTRFFRLPPQALAGSEELPAGHPARELLMRWTRFAAERRWGALLQSMLEQSGLLAFDLEHDSAGADRARANFRHLCGELARAAYAADLDLLGMLTWLEQKRQQPDDNSDLQPVETDQPRVKIMTIHAAKGLEFPVVFVAGGFTQGRPPSFLTYRNSDRQLVHDVRVGNQTTKQEHQREQDARDRRVYYVALTRAMFKLYLPHLGARKRQGRPGPLATILAPAIMKSDLAALGALYVSLVDAPQECLVRRRAFRATPATVVADSKAAPVVDLFPALDPNLAQRRIRIHSFSSLHRDDRAAAEPAHAERVSRDDSLPDPTPGQELLRGPVFGEMVHDLLEALDFTVVGQARDPAALLKEARQPIDDALLAHWLKLPLAVARRPDVEEQCREELARLAWCALHTPLQAAGGALWKVPSSDRLQELEFLLPGHVRAAADGEESYLTGFIDLVFRRGGRYFLVDWKTNTLESYTPDAIRASMAECDYTLQYRLYLRALARWLERVHGPGFDFANACGGVYYLYLRGLNGHDETSGVFCHRPTLGEWMP